MKIHPVVNVSKVVRYRELVKEYKIEKPKSVKVNREEEQEVKIMLNKRIM